MDMPGLRGEIVRTAVMAMTTTILGFVVAGVTGVFGKIDAIADIKKSQDAQAAQVLVLKEQMDKAKDNANDLKSAIVGFSAEHKFLIETVKELRDDLAEARRAR
jgi:vacuolar-type H+-ATPase subunit F/Vma7